jgi:anion-transporting  ArsA/GET3 family ATPase
MLKDLAQTKRILVVAGPGGVGKTTTAAALGVVAARGGRKTLVCTIDPAPRLADALGVAALSAEPGPLSQEARAALGIGRAGELHAARLDTTKAFNRLVEEQVTDPEMRRRIFQNQIYRQITGTLTGSQEYAATLALFDLYSRNEYDLIVLDTPPTANALDFLDAPRRIAEAVASPALRWFARPAASTGIFSWQGLRAGGALALRQVGKFVGSQFLDDLGAFLVDFRVVLGGFLERAHAIDALLRRPEVGFLLVMSPEVPAVNEALFFRDRLRSSGIALGGFIANRVLPPPGISERADLRVRLGALPQLHSWAPEILDRATDDLAHAATYLQQAAESQRLQIERLRESSADVPVTQVPLLAHEVTTLASLRTMVDYLAQGT